MRRPQQTYDWPAIRACYELGCTPNECQRRFDISNGAWHGAVQRGAIVLRDNRGARTGTRAEVGRLHEAGLSQAEIARRLGISRVLPGCHSAAECRAAFGFSRNAWADAIRRGAITPRPRCEPIEAILVAGRRRSRYHIKSRLALAGLKVERCEQCGLTDWRGQPISLELHHVNGDGQDNRLENLRLLCPNCHSQTDTWGARNKVRR